MNKELPKMYHSSISKPINSIQKIYTTINNGDNVSVEVKYPNISIDKKIANIFNSSDYVYKADVTIVTDTDTVHKRIIAKNKNNFVINDIFIHIIS